MSKRGCQQSREAKLKSHYVSCCQDDRRSRKQFPSKSQRPNFCSTTQATDREAFGARKFSQGGSSVPAIPEYGLYKGFHSLKYLAHRILSRACCTIGFSILIVCAVTSQFRHPRLSNNPRPLNELENTRKAKGRKRWRYGKLVKSMKGKRSQVERS